MSGRAVAIVQARLGSMRLPGKVLESICGKVLLERSIAPVERSRCISDICIATTGSRADDVLVELCGAVGYRLFRGPEDDVVRRYVDTIDQLHMDDDELVVRICGDNLFTDVESLDTALEDFMADPTADLVTNAGPEGYPPGTIWEFAPAGLLRKLNRLPLSAHEREHVFIYVHSRPDEYRVRRLTCPQSIRDSNLRLTIDEARDLEFARAFFKLIRNDQPMTLTEIADLSRSHPEVFAINRFVEQRTLADGIARS